MTPEETKLRFDSIVDRLKTELENLLHEMDSTDGEHGIIYSMYFNVILTP